MSLRSDGILEKSAVVATVVFSIPSLALLNLLFAVISVVAAFRVDQSKFPISCDIERFELVLIGGYQSMANIASETAVALWVAELGVPDFLSTPLIPLVFMLAWIVKAILEEQNVIVRLVNGILVSCTFAAVGVGFFAKMSYWQGTENIKQNIYRIQWFIESVRADAIRAHKNFVKDDHITSCNVAFEMYTLATSGLCKNGNMYDCYVEVLANEEKHKYIIKQTESWIYKK